MTINYKHGGPGGPPPRGQHPQKRSRPFGLAKTPFDPRTGTFVGFASNEQIAVFTVVEEGFDAILCTDRDSKKALVAKPRPLREIVYTAETFSGFPIELWDVNTRAIRDGSDYFGFEFHDPYEVGEEIVAFKHFEQELAEVEVESTEFVGVIDPGTYYVAWADLNVRGRRWDRGSEADFEIDEIHSDWLTVHQLGVEGSDAAIMYVALPPRLRVSTFDGETINGVDYESTGSQERTATQGAEVETHLITPSYYVGERIRAIRSSFVDSGGYEYWWEEASEGREWALEA